MIELADIFQDGMVLQCNKPVCVWGKSAPMKDVVVEIQKQHAETTADKNGHWHCTLSSMNPAYRENLIVKTDGECICIRDVAIGEVWIAAGQSNMEFPLKYEQHRMDEKGEFSENIRFFDVSKISFDGQDKIFDYHKVNRWRKADPEDLDYFSAAGYYFAKDLFCEINIPVGIIGCNLGGTLAEAWMNEETVRRVSPNWYHSFIQHFQGMDMAAYWEKQRTGTWNDKGSPINDVNDVILPHTLTEKEFNKLLFGDENSESNDTLEAFEGWSPEAFPGTLYEHMVRKISDFTVRGVLWYQGESDDTDLSRDRYGEILTALINDWRKLWNDKLPFLVVQLPGLENWVGLENFGYEIIRQKQQDVSDQMEAVWLCSISDAGERWDIHPKNKKTVGNRLALLALGHVYGEKILCDAPRCTHVKRENKRLICEFENAGTGLWIENGKILPLQIRSGGKDIAFDVSVKENLLIVDLSEEYSGRMQISFAQDKWFQVNLYNSAGIPALPFKYEIR